MIYHSAHFDDKLFYLMLPRKQNKIKKKRKYSFSPHFQCSELKIIFKEIHDIKEVSVFFFQHIGSRDREIKKKHPI